MKTENELYDVAIVGYGPVGATLAGLLGQEGLKVLVLDREADIYPLPRAIHFDGEVMRIFQSLGLKDKVLEISRPGIHGMHFVNAEGETLLVRAGSNESGPNGCANNYYFHQPQLEVLLREKAASHENVTLRLSTELIGIQEQSDCVELTAQNHNTHASSHYRVKYVVGCDGARSFVRNTMNSPMENLGLRQQWLVFDVLLKQNVELPPYTIQHCDPARPMTYCNVVDNRRRWEIMVMPDDNLEELVKPENIWKMLERWINPEQADLERAVIYTFNSLIAQGWRKGRLMLAGDAAHQTPPFLGQGLCAGIRDAANLYWKLTSIIKGNASDTLLDTYESERSAHVHEVIGLAVYLGSIIQTTDPDKAAERDRKLREDGCREFFMPVSQLGEGLWDSQRKAGGQLFFQPRNREGIALDDLVGNRFAIVHTDKAGFNKLEDALAERANIVPVELDNQEVGNWLAEKEAEFVVLRPDRYVLGTGKNKAQLQALLSLVP
ncbi:bifunctional 3-(3-hydroxy-phenyl)propionate/3-hydroxycinnamic acid hydroxylase [Advenella sp. WQ 585]|uniref:Bifunctional 3-(3-hydroxy-phenyl)propionate/3-hydroxycinnamic acid hydroxylase n=1 Tax=Advenella mandrilli TaxID=2800330 RepID=A0ABS1ECM8_9BURK|nr:bifunctional 3-(3-hydroxy-phenyl)propionate/3-hydroxycinnamic acid hydroxylase [Advenella mandrilli]MBK1780638.1 bifunctional 3-(3-hydroxy-phenyl)propionate/3-hydroxycinnamic acid hydroxylase [Advenella mandrilli]